MAHPSCYDFYRKGRVVKMILTDYFLAKHDIMWDYAKQCGVQGAVLRAPEEETFDVTDQSHWQDIYKRFLDFGIPPMVLEPMPDSLHTHIKIGDEKRDESIEKVIKMLPILQKLNITTICFNWMAHIGWLRTSDSVPERGGAKVTGFDLGEFKPGTQKITAAKLWENYEYFLKAVMPYAEKYEIKLALHPDDPPLLKLGNVERIMISRANIEKAIHLYESPYLGITMCQATYCMMGEDIYKIIEDLREKIFFVHFRNAVGSKEHFHETFHDNGMIDMKKAIRYYQKFTPHVPVRVDHVPLMAGEEQSKAGYTHLGRLFAIGYLKGLMEEERNYEF